MTKLGTLLFILALPIIMGGIILWSWYLGFMTMCGYNIMEIIKGKNEKH